MKFLTILYVAVIFAVSPGRIAKINALKSAAKTAYNSGDYKTAIEKYKYLVDSLQVSEDEVILNLAHAYFQLNDSSNSVEYYRRIAQSENPKISSLAHQQLGVQANRKSHFEEALAHFKQSLKADPSNQDSRYNYELLSKKLKDKDNNKEDQDEKGKDKKDQDKKGKDKKDQDKKDQDKKGKDKKDQDKKGKDKKDQDKKGKDKKDQDKKDQQDIRPSVSENLKAMKMSEEKAKMILEAMKNREVQYLQQKKRKQTQPKDNTKPDW